MTTPFMRCHFCKNVDEGSLKSENPTCRAFPDGIPLEIFMGSIAHITRQVGDHDILFVPNNKIKSKK